MIHPDTYVRQTDKGLGVFAARDFDAGEILWVEDQFDLVIPQHRYQELSEHVRARIQVHGYVDSQQRIIVAWDDAKLVNHSCEPNCAGLLQFDGASIATRPIHRDQEITEDYDGYFAHFESFACQCGAPGCRGLVHNIASFRPACRADLRQWADTILAHDQPLLSEKLARVRGLRRLLNSYASGPVRLHTRRPAATSQSELATANFATG